MQVLGPKASVRPQRLWVKRDDGVTPKRKHLNRLAQHSCKGGVENIEPAGIGPESGQDQPIAIKGETPPSHPSPPRTDLGARVIMARDLHPSLKVAARVGCMTKDQIGRGDFGAGSAGQAIKAFAVMIARHPNKIAKACKSGQAVLVFRQETCGAVAVVETIAEKDQLLGRESRNLGLEALQGDHRIIGRDQLSPGRVT